MKALSIDLYHLESMFSGTGLLLIRVILADAHSFDNRRALNIRNRYILKVGVLGSLQNTSINTPSLHLTTHRSSVRIMPNE